ncbi:MAG: ABC transporter permease [Gemmatimonadota bacterium]
MPEGVGQAGRTGWGQWYAALLWLYPARFRARYGDEMVDFFERDLSQARGWRRLGVLTRAASDAVINGPRERRRAGAHDSGRGAVETIRDFGRDVRWGVRSLRRRPGFSAIAILTVALGIGSANTVFTVVDAVVLEPLPYPESDRLVSMWTTFGGQAEAFGLSLAEHYDYAQQSRALEALGSFGEDQETLTGFGNARRVSVAWTWGELYEVVGASVHIGRLPGPAEIASGASPVALLSYDMWSSLFGSDSSVVGRMIDLSDEPVEVIGVLSAETRLPTTQPEIWRPIAQSRVDIGDRSGHWLTSIGRLAPSATLETLQVEIEETHERWRTEWAGVHSPGHPGHSFVAGDAHERFFGELRSAGLLLLVAIAALLLLACANVASMLLARGEARAAERALQRALGAGTSRIVRAQVMESLLIAGTGGLVGILLSQPAVQLLLSLAPAEIPRTDTVGVDGRVLAFSVSATLLAALLFGTLPALWSTRGATKGWRGSVGADRSLAATLSGLVMGQVAVAITLLTGASLVLGTVRALTASDDGFTTEGRVTFQLGVTSASYPELGDVRAFWSSLLQSIETIPGVEETAVARILPLRDPLRREGMQIVDVTPSGESVPIVYGLTSTEYFELMEIPILEGRAFAPSDRDDTPWVGVVNETAARTYWPGTTPIGSRVNPLFMPDSLGAVTIVGVVGDVHAEGPRAVVEPELTLSYEQMQFGPGYMRVGSVVARTSVAPESVLPRVAEAVSRVDPAVPVTQASTLREVARDARARERFLATIVLVFAGLSLTLAFLGTYGVVAYAVSQRVREYGVRRALGAQRGNIAASVFRRGALLTAGGVVAGLTGSFFVGTAMEGFLFEIDARDPWALVAPPLVAGLAVLIACAVPAVRASRADPLESLRAERS